LGLCFVFYVLMLGDNMSILQKAKQCILVSCFLTFLAPAGAQDWPQWLGTKRDGVWRESGVLEKFPKTGPQVVWRAPVSGGYAGPAVSGGKVFLTDRRLEIGSKDPENLFQRANSKGFERVLCLDGETGKQIWEHSYPCQYSISYPCGPRCTPVVAEGRIFALGAMGNLLALDAATGKVLWQVDFVKDWGSSVPVWGFAAHPLLVGDALICLVGGKEQGSLVVAFDKKTGQTKWKSLQLESPQSEIGYCPPTLIELGGKAHVVIWHPEAVECLDPATGEKRWSVPFRIKANLSVPTPRLAGKRLLVTSFYNGSMLLDLGQDGSSAKVLWKGAGRGERPSQTDGLHSIMSTPWIDGEQFYGVCSYGELRGLDLATGKRLWSDLRATGAAGKPASEPSERWANAFIVPHEDKYFLFNEKGDLIIAKLTRSGYEEVDRAHVLEPTGSAAMGGPPRGIVWSHPAFAMKSMFARNDKELIRVSLTK
jgi:outer membrane protein assembly factor BamB